MRYGGVEKWLNHLSLDFTNLGNEVVYFNAMQKNGVYNNVSYKASKFNLVKVQGSFNRNILYSLIFGISALVFIVKKWRQYDLIYIHQSPLFPILFISTYSKLYRKLREKIIVEFIEYWPKFSFQKRNTCYSRWQSEIFYSFFKFLVYISPQIITFSKLHYEKLYLINKNIHIMPGQISNDLKIYRRKIKIPRQFLIVSRLSPEKNVESGILIFKKMFTLLGVMDLELNIVGSGTELNNLKKLCIDIGINDCVNFLGNVSEEEIGQLFQNSDVLIHQSKREGFGLVVAEAAAHGVPSILLESPLNAATELCQHMSLVLNASDEPKQNKKLKEFLENYSEESKRCTDWFINAKKDKNVRTTAIKILNLV